MDGYSSRVLLGLSGFDFSQAGMAAKMDINEERQLKQIEEWEFKLWYYQKQHQIELRETMRTELLVSFHCRAREEIEGSAGKAPTSRSKNCREWGQGGFS